VLFHFANSGTGYAEQQASAYETFLRWFLQGSHGMHCPAIEEMFAKYETWCFQRSGADPSFAGAGRKDWAIRTVVFYFQTQCVDGIYSYIRPCDTDKGRWCDEGDITAACENMNYE
jgi:hypothetical protein